MSGRLRLHAGVPRLIGVLAITVVAVAACGGSGSPPGPESSAVGPSAPSSAPATPVPLPPSPARAPGTAWSEEFTGARGSAPDPTLFQARTGGNGWGNNELESYTDRPANVALDGAGHLVLSAVRGTFRGADGYRRDWTSGRLDTLGKWSFTQGTLAARIKLPAGAGMWPAFWLLGTSITHVGWPRCGEIDVMEAPAGKGGIFQTVHGPNATNTGYAVSERTRVPPGMRIAADFHTFWVSRTPGVIRFGIDNATTKTITRKNLAAGQRWVFDEPMFFVLNLAVGGWPGAPSAATPSPSRLLVDWIKYSPLPV